MTGVMSDARIDLILNRLIPIDGSESVWDPLLEAIDRAPLVLIGEASHGTREFYEHRAALTRRLILEKRFNAVAVEADWPDAYRVNLYVRGRGDDRDADSALAGFRRFPTWMWRNTVMVEFVEWLRSHNAALPEIEKVGFYGLDLYSLHRSIDAVLTYLDTIDPRAAERARARYTCFEVFGSDPQAYGYAASYGLRPSCEREVIAQLVDLQRQAAAYAKRDGHIAADEYFSAEQNARVVSDAESYYRVMFGGCRQSWNLRDRHMMSTLEATFEHVSRTSGEARAVVWAHNSHLGDARATQMGAQGELNLGQLVRETFGRDALSIGFTTHTGSVTAASNWDEPAQLMAVRPSLVGSYERLFHDAGLEAFLLDLRGPVASALAQPRLERAIGVVYRPETERASHYFMASMARQFDLVIHYDETRALEPLELWSRREMDLPETFPTGV